MEPVVPLSRFPKVRGLEGNEWTRQAPNKRKQITPVKVW